MGICLLLRQAAPAGKGTPSAVPIAQQKPINRERERAPYTFVDGRESQLKLSWIEQCADANPFEWARLSFSCGKILSSPSKTSFRANPLLDQQI